jgi:hypothetical protein
VPENLIQSKYEHDSAARRSSLTQQQRQATTTSNNDSSTSNTPIPIISMSSIDCNVTSLALANRASQRAVAPTLKSRRSKATDDSNQTSLCSTDNDEHIDDDESSSTARPLLRPLGMLYAWTASLLWCLWTKLTSPTTHAQSRPLSSKSATIHDEIDEWMKNPNFRKQVELSLQATDGREKTRRRRESREKTSS